MAIEVLLCKQCGAKYNGNQHAECPYCANKKTIKKTKSESWSWKWKKNTSATVQSSESPKNEGTEAKAFDTPVEDVIPNHTIGYYKVPDDEPQVQPVTVEPIKKQQPEPEKISRAIKPENISVSDNIAEYTMPRPAAAPVQPQSNALGGQIEKLGKTTAKYINTESEENTYPVVGWLISVKGIYYGQSFPLKTGGNRIGRSHEFEVALLKENSVSRKSVLEIVYDSRANEFNALLGESRNECRINNKLLYSNDRIQLHGYEEIEFGDTEDNLYVFVPMCGEHFTWGKYPPKKN